MTQTINITQEILDGLPSGDHILKVVGTTTSGFSAEDTATFATVSDPTIFVDAEQGEHAEEFTFDITILAINDNATVYGYIDGMQFYQLNFGIDGTYTIKVTDNMLYPIAGGEHTITFNLTDKRGKAASASTTFTKTYTSPIVSVTSNLGDRTGAFAVPFTIMNAMSEHPALAAYVDTTVTPIFVTDDASQINSVTIDAELFASLDDGSHSLILVVTNEAGSTTKTAIFNKAVPDRTFTGLKLGYFDDTWDGTVLEDRIYTEKEVVYAGETYKSYEDKTPYDTEGEVVTGGLLAAMSRGVQDAGASSFIKNSDGSYTETSANGVSNIARTSTGYVEVFTDKVGNVLTKNVSFNTDGTVSESTTYERA